MIAAAKLIGMGVAGVRPSGRTLYRSLNSTLDSYELLNLLERSNLSKFIIHRRVPTDRPAPDFQRNFLGTEFPLSRPMYSYLFDSLG